MSISLVPGFTTPVLVGLTGLSPIAPANAIVLFSVCPRTDQGDRTVTFRPNANGTVTTLTANLESSDDNGATWTTYPGGGTLTFSALAQVQVLHLVAGLMYRLNPQSLSFGTATSVNINAQIS